MHYSLALVFALVTTASAYADVRILDVFSGIPFDLATQTRSDLTIDQSLPGFAKLELRADNSVLRITPSRIGSGAINIRQKRTGKILHRLVLNINDPRLIVIERDLKKVLNDVSGISIRVLAGRVIIDGQVTVPSEVNRIHSAVKMFGNDVRSLVTLSPASYPALAKLIEREIGNPEIRVRIVNGHILLEGYANSKDEADRADVIAQTYAHDIVVDEAVADRKIVKRHPN